jgi:hypothetical protein
MDVLERLTTRLKKIGIEIELVGNYPWIYLQKVNGNRIKKEDFYYANHGFTIAFLPFQLDEKMEMLDIKKTFYIIRKYI